MSMRGKKSYLGIDIARLIAAILVITIHTSPLASYSENADFILTRVIARTAVPFFFMTSGFFLVSRYSKDWDRLKRFVKKTAVVYIAAIILYVPINIYNHYFNDPELLPKLINDIIFDGTMYHLWYLPASILGSCIALLALKKLGYSRALAASAVLYIIGLFGDSYYGLIGKIPVIGGIYGGMFQIFDYTRNGLFFAPLFFILGGAFADGFFIPKRRAIAGLTGSLGLMGAEAIILHRHNIPRHDSMYILLPFVMVFAFSLIIGIKGRRPALVRDISLIVYIIHPMAIVFIRAFSRITGLSRLLVDNSFGHFIAVSLVSAASAAALSLVFQAVKLRRGAAPAVGERERAWIELDLSSLKHNIKTLNIAIPGGCRLMAVVKAGAYGHGAYNIAVCLEKNGVKAFAVATVDEGIELRRYGISGEILILGYTPPHRASDLKKYSLTQTIVGYEHAQALNSCGIKIKAHIKLDTGMHRLGFDCEDINSLLQAFRLKNITVTGIYTHLAASDSLEDEAVRFTISQIQSFYAAIAGLEESGIKIPKTHIQSSYGLLNYPKLKCDYVRTGVALYGVKSSPGDRTRLDLDLRPVLSLKSRVVQIKKLKNGDNVGYGLAFTAESKMRIAIISIGYADGLPRCLSGGRVIINGQLAAIVGRICMDQMAVDITELGDIEVGAEAVIIDPELPAESVAYEAGSITNELLSRLGGRLRIVEV